VCVVASAAAASNERCAGVRLAAVAARTATAVCRRDVRTVDAVRRRPPADADPQEFLRYADGSPPKIHGRGLTRITYLSSALGKLTR